MAYLTAVAAGVCFPGFLLIAQEARHWSVSRSAQRSSTSPRYAAVGASTAGQTQTQQPATERFRFQPPTAIGLSRDLLCYPMTRTSGEVV